MSNIKGTQSTVVNLDFYNSTQRKFRFPNNYGASIIQHRHSYGGPELAELAVIKFTNGKGVFAHFNLDYKTPITSDVIGYLTEIEIQKLLHKIAELPK